MNAADSHADTLCFYLFLLMRQGVHGVHPEPANCGRRTAGGDAGVTRIPAIFGLPFDTDTWNSFA